MTENQSAIRYEAGRRRHRRPHPRRPDRQRQHDERALRPQHGRGRGPAREGEGRDHRCGDHVREEDLLRRRQPQGPAVRRGRPGPGRSSTRAGP
ncbi:hypothetical protein [Nocardioides sp. B-3]|uniref:hypothetical protein n=1 Tax=Nocardioides sp. B-3 TaxID=2895565 RepID=UPI002342D914|nr:hypothetical protein [Nocardioides sp. B-3]